jgi:hypothetical protein
MKTHPTNSTTAVKTQHLDSAIAALGANTNRIATASSVCTTASNSKQPTMKTNNPDTIDNTHAAIVRFPETGVAEGTLLPGVSSKPEYAEDWLRKRATELLEESSEDIEDTAFGVAEDIALEVARKCYDRAFNRAFDKAFPRVYLEALGDACKKAVKKAAKEFGNGHRRPWRN